MRLEPAGKKRLVDLALDGALIRQKQVLGELLGDGGSALHHAAGPRVGHQRAKRAVEVDAVVLVKAAILGGQHGLDQMVRHLLERYRIVVLDAAIADLVAVAVEESHGELGLLQPILVRGFAEGRDGERQHQEKTKGAPCRGLR